MKKGPIVAISILGIMIASNIAYYFFKNKKSEAVQMMGTNPSLNQKDVQMHPQP